MSYVFTHQNYLTDGDIKAVFDDLYASPALYDTVFYSHQQKTAEDWLAYIRGGCWMCRVEDGGAVLGAFWMDRFRGQVANFHFFGFPASWGRARRIAREAVPFVANSCPTLSGLVGEVPARNRMALMYARDCGFVTLTTIPKAVVHNDGGVDDLVISYCSLEGYR